MTDLPAASFRACGKLILFGEHFVVHGGPALALPVTSVSTQVTIRALPGREPYRFKTDALVSEAEQARGLVDLALERLGIDPCPGPNEHWEIVANSSVPIGYGLGSSASFSVALLGALARAVSRPIAPEELKQHAHALEQLVHGTPSGIDDTVVSFGRPIWFCRDRPVQFLDPPVNVNQFMLLASSGGPGSTKRAVSRVQALRQAKPERFEELCEQARELARQGRQAFLARDLQHLGRLMDRNHELLQIIGVSTPGLDRLVETARRAGALGAKLTGAGQGGFIVTLVDESTEVEVRQALRRAGVPQVLGLG